MTDEQSDGYARYMHLLVDAMQPHLERITSERGDVMSQGIAADIIGQDRPALPPAESTPNELVLWELFREATAVSRAFDDLRDFEVYVAGFPYDGTRVTRGRHLQSVVSSYFQAIYVFRERLKRQLNTIKRLWKPSRLQLDVNRRIDPVLAFVLDRALDGATKIRGIHVHEREYTDDDLDLIYSLDFLSEHVLPTDEAVKLARERADNVYAQARERWAGTILELNNALEAVRDYVYGEARLAVFADDGAVRFPGDHV